MAVAAAAAVSLVSQRFVWLPAVARPHQSDLCADACVWRHWRNMLRQEAPLKSSL